MRNRHAVPGLALVLLLELAGCSDELPRTATIVSAPHATAVLGGYGPGNADRREGAGLTDGRGRAIPPPPVPAGIHGQAVRSGEASALALWVQDGTVMAASWSREGGWSSAQPLEEIHGAASDAQLASNGRGSAMALWRHTVGSIQSLRSSRFEQATGWSPPDVLPGALPRPDAAAGTDDSSAPRLQMDVQGNATAQWPSGFAADEIQSARFSAGQGWSRASSRQLAAAPAAPASAR